MDAIKALKAAPIAERRELKLSCGLTEFPLEILDLADSLEFLNLSNNHLSTLPDAFAQLKNLRIAFFNDNQFEEFPAVLAACPKLSMVSFKNNQIAAISEEALAPTLRWLTLTHNHIAELPAAIGKLPKLQKLMLAGNRLRSLPRELAACKNLELIRIAANQLQEFPHWLLTLPRLAWVAYAGNPFCQANTSTQSASSARSLPTISWSALTVGNLLGQGASGEIYQGLWTQTASQSGEGQPQQVAIKLFKGDITSDGSPLDEMQACMAAGHHPNLVTVVGRLVDHPDGKAGLVFAFLPKRYQTLGNPPSLESCTRDTYQPETTFTPAMILQIARGIASVVAHLHDRGILHGDLYAHNILVNDSGESILSDFGAASFYNPMDSALSYPLEQIEARAFGCLLEDLVDRAAEVDEERQTTMLSQLRSLQQDCMVPNLAQRPRFQAIYNQLASL